MEDRSGRLVQFPQAHGQVQLAVQPMSTIGGVIFDLLLGQGLLPVARFQPEVADWEQVDGLGVLQ